MRLLFSLGSFHRAARRDDKWVSYRPFLDPDRKVQKQRSEPGNLREYYCRTNLFRAKLCVQHRMHRSADTVVLGSAQPDNTTADER